MVWLAMSIPLKQRWFIWPCYDNCWNMTWRTLDTSAPLHSNRVWTVTTLHLHVPLRQCVTTDAGVTWRASVSQLAGCFVFPTGFGMTRVKERRLRGTRSSMHDSDPEPVLGEWDRYVEHVFDLARHIGIVWIQIKIHGAYLETSCLNFKWCPVKSLMDIVVSWRLRFFCMNFCTVDTSCLNNGRELKVTTSLST